MEDQQPDSGDLTTDANEVAPPTEAAQRSRRWRFLRRSATQSPEPQPEPAAEDSAVEPTDDAKPAPRTPVGKKGRTTKAVAPAEEPIEAEPVPEQTVEAAEDESEVETTESEPTESSEEEPVELVPHQPAGKRLKIAAVAAAALFVAAGAFAGAMLQPYLADRALVRTKVDIARTAANAITTLWTYTPEDMEALPDRSAKFLAGDFAHEYRRYIDAIVATNKQAQVSNDTQVMGTAVESVTPSEATAIVYTNSVATSPVSKNIPSLRYLSYRLTMERHGAEWLISRMTAITKLDLTPQL